ncbi:FadR family transcriptional regulator [Pseudonocardia sp. C8]|uniref:FadR/GntR family transcriptional regulator n=1 Tax=Pseudonocardia sp. C8 TaxID=2762759 RepID=UPI001642722D|nr:FCD domain-containing protein [Pseudonocardia sp. C8]MBC3194879.1 FadR family transcriptional regulator [Pseudonocardia sp. C8]
MVTSTSLAQAVANHLRGIIHCGEVSAGESLPAERELASQLGIARMSLRSAITQLCADGYVEVRPGPSGGTYVTELQQPAEAWCARMRGQAGELEDMVDFRIALETGAVVHAARRRSAEDLEALRASITALRGVGNRAGLRRVDSRFHLGLARAARSERFADAIQTSRCELFDPHDLLPVDDLVDETAVDHERIIAAVQDRDADRAASAMREHLEHTRARLQRIIRGVDAPAPSPAHRRTG